MIPRIFAGETVFIIAGGPSLDGFDYGRLAGRRTIGINRAYEFTTDLDVLWFADHRFFRKHRDGISAHPATWKATLAPRRETRGLEPYPPGFVQYRCTGMRGFDPNPRHLRSGNNSTYLCMHLAAHSRPRRIVVLGLDMRHAPDGRTHFHDGHRTESGAPLLHRERTLKRDMLPYFRDLVAPLAERGIEVYVGNPDSLVDCWPRVSITEALEL